MKNYLFLLLIATCISLSGCRGENQELHSKDVGQKESQLDKIILDVVVNKDDNFSLYYTTDGSIDFKQTNPIWVPVQGKKEVQQVTFELPEDVHLPQLRLDFGTNKEQEDIILKAVTIVYGQKIRTLKGPEVFRHFRPDYTRCKANRSTGTLKGIVRGGVKFSPSLYPNEKVLAKLMLELSQ